MHQAIQNFRNTKDELVFLREIEIFIHNDATIQKKKNSLKTIFKFEDYEIPIAETATNFLNHIKNNPHQEIENPTAYICKILNNNFVYANAEKNKQKTKIIPFDDIQTENLTQEEENERTISEKIYYIIKEYLPNITPENCKKYFEIIIFSFENKKKNRENWADKDWKDIEIKEILSNAKNLILSAYNTKETTESSISQCKKKIGKLIDTKIYKD